MDIDKFISKYENQIAKGKFDPQCIPKDLNNQDLWKKIVKINYTYLQSIPKEYISDDLILNIIYKNYCTLNDYLFAFLEPFLNQLLCDAIAIASPYLIKYFPKQFRNTETINYARKTLLENKLLIPTIPEELLNELGEDFFIEISKKMDFINHVPKKFRTKEICTNIVLNNPEELNKLNPQYFDIKLIETLIDMLGERIIDYLPKGYYLSPQIYEKIFEYDSVFLKRNIFSFFKNLPPEFRTIKMWQKMIHERPVTMHSLASQIPDGVLTEPFLTSVIEKNPNNIRYIPRKYLTKEFITKLIKLNHLYINFIPKNLVTIELEKLAKWESLKESTGIVSSLIAMTTEGGSLEAIAKANNVSTLYVNNIVEAIKEANPNLYLEIKNKLSQNQTTWLIETKENCQKLGMIIESLGPIKGIFLSREQKTKFAYLYHKYINRPLESIYDYIIRSKDNFDNQQIIIFFFKKVLKYNRLNTDALVDEKKTIEYNNKWLKPFNKKDYFKIVDDKPTAENKYLEHTITIDDVDKIIKILKQENIPANDIIVKEAIRKYYDNTLSDYINELHSYDSIINLPKTIKK